MCKARLRIGTDIGVGPSVEGALFDAREVIGRKIVAESVTLLNPGIQLSRGGGECERRRIAHAGGERRLAGAVRLEALNLGLDLRLHADVARGPNPHQPGSGFWIPPQLPVLVA